MKRNWGRGAWITATNGIVIWRFLNGLLNSAYKQLRLAIDPSYNPTLWEQLRGQPVVMAIVAVLIVGIVLEWVRPKWAMWVNCGIWVMISADMVGSIIYGLRTGYPREHLMQAGIYILLPALIFMIVNVILYRNYWKPSAGAQ